MKKVVLFKSESEEWAREFGAADYEAVFVPPLRFEEVAAGAARLATAVREAAHDALVLTSARAAEALARAWRPDSPDAWRHKPLYCVGEATARAAAPLGLQARLTGAGSAQALAEGIARQHAAGASLLFPCGNLRVEALADTLRARGMRVEALTVYETREHEQLRGALQALSRAERAPVGMVFFSPSGCEYAHRQLQTFSNRLSSLPHFAIGSSTAHKIENLGVEPAGVAAAPRPAAMLAALQAYFAPQAALKAAATEATSS